MKRPDAVAAFGGARGRAPTSLAEGLPSRPAVAPPAWLSAFDGEPVSPHGAQASPAIDVAALRAELRAEAERAASARVEELSSKYLEGYFRLEEAVRGAAQVRAESAVDLALVVARELCGHALALDEQALRDAVGKVAAPEEPVRVRVAPADYQRLVERQEERAFDSTLVALIADAALAPGGFVVETAREVIDGSVEARLEALRAALVEVLRAGQPEAAC